MTKPEDLRKELEAATDELVSLLSTDAQLALEKWHAATERYVFLTRHGDYSRAMNRLLEAMAAQSSPLLGRNQLDIEDQIKEGGRVMDEFSQGVFFAASVLVRIHDLPTEAADILNEAGLVKADVSSLDDYEKEAMRELVKSEGSRLNFIGLEAGHD